MDKILFSLLFFATFSLVAQTPQGIPYQAVARNTSGVPLVNQNIKIRFSIRDSILSGAIVYRETHATSTTALGLFSLNVGMGTPVTGTFTGINWGKNAKFLQVEIDPTGGNSFNDLGTQQMMSVPYALFSATSGALHAEPYDTSSSYLYFQTTGVFSNGTGIDGDFVSNGNLTLDGVKQYSNFRLRSGDLLNIGDQGYLVLRVKDTCDILGAINGIGKNLNPMGSGGGSGGGAGGFSECSNKTGYQSVTEFLEIPGGLPSADGLSPNFSQKLTLIETHGTLRGAKGGNGCARASVICDGVNFSGIGGNGGAGLLVFCRYLRFSGSINCSGQSGTFGFGGSGGGGGGGVLISAKKYLQNSGTIVSNGGDPGGSVFCTSSSGKGGAGWILLITQ